MVLLTLSHLPSRVWRGHSCWSKLRLNASSDRWQWQVIDWWVEQSASLSPSLQDKRCRSIPLPPEPSEVSVTSSAGSSRLSRDLRCVWPENRAVDFAKVKAERLLAEPQEWRITFHNPQVNFPDNSSPFVENCPDPGALWGIKDEFCPPPCS